MGSVTEKVTRLLPCNIIVTKFEEVFKLRISTEIDDIDKHYKRGNELADLGYYRELVKIILEKLMDRKIEEEVRKHYRLGK